jgi:CheY-like chemotaxis protein
MKVFVVDDDELVRTVAVDTLEDAGFEVIEAATAEEALDRCEERTADILFTDITLSGRLDGWDIAERCHEADPKLPVVYTTGYSFKESRAVTGGRVLHKPWRPEDLVVMIRDVAGQSPESRPGGS